MNKSEKILGEIGQYTADLVDILGARKVVIPMEKRKGA